MIRIAAHRAPARARELRLFRGEEAGTRAIGPDPQADLPKTPRASPLVRGSVEVPIHSAVDTATLEANPHPRP
jgi:hypothetical protein